MRKRMCLRMSPSGGEPFVMGAGRLSMGMLKADFGMSTCRKSDGATMILIDKGMGVRAGGGLRTALTPDSVLYFRSNGVSRDGIGARGCAS